MASLGVSRETKERLSLYVESLLRWQSVVNLISPSTIASIWSRHIEDSLQLGDLASGRVWVDLGSGGGLPGIVLAIAHPGRLMHLIEADSRKCAFLRDTVRRLDLSVEVHEGRIEDVLPGVDGIEVVTARGLASLGKLMELTASPLALGAIGLFPKGRNHQVELTRARESMTFRAELIASRTDPDARIVRVTQFGGHAAAAER